MVRSVALGATFGHYMITEDRSAALSRRATSKARGGPGGYDGAGRQDHVPRRIRSSGVPGSVDGAAPFGARRSAGPGRADGARLRPDPFRAARRDHLRGQHRAELHRRRDAGLAGRPVPAPGGDVPMRCHPSRSCCSWSSRACRRPPWWRCSSWSPSRGLRSRGPRGDLSRCADGRPVRGGHRDIADHVPVRPGPRLREQAARWSGSSARGHPCWPTRRRSPASALIVRAWVRPRPARRRRRAATAVPRGWPRSSPVPGLVLASPALRTPMLFGWLAAFYNAPEGVVAPLAGPSAAAPSPWG